MTPLFEVRDLRVTYRRPGEKPLEAVKGVSFSLAEGETLHDACVAANAAAAQSVAVKYVLPSLPYRKD